MFKNLLVVGALSLSSLAFAGPVHGARPVAPGRGVPPPPMSQPVRNDVRNDRFDVAEGRRLLRSYDTAAARRDTRTLSMLDGQIANFINGELNEARRERTATRQLTNLQNKLSRLYGRFDVRAVNTKRDVLNDAVNFAERDLYGSRSDRFARR